MRRKILLSLLALLFVCGFAVDVTWSASADLYEYGALPYKPNELIVRFAETELRPAQGLTAVTGPWSRRVRRSTISDSIVPGATVVKEYDNVAPGLVSVQLPEGTNILDAFIQFNLSDNVDYAEPNYKYRLFLAPNDPSKSRTISTGSS